ncbi:MAG TPA: class I fructose-bisphosphate aldolase [Streptosporangiaceae bacterium]|nr:class I fructose-bisphosphate aldolase [Streptosporangiaceae bacterium]
MLGLDKVAAALVAPGKGILAADESIATMSRRLEAVGAAPTADNRRDYRRLLLTTPGLENWVSGIILCDETLGQDLPDGTPFGEAAAALGIMAGVKVDKGVTPLPFSDGGFVTEGLDGLRGRLDAYRERGAVFAKWRAVLNPAMLHWRTVHANAHALARYAALCQTAGIVPIVEPEVLMDGSHGIAVCQSATASVLDAVFGELDAMGVDPRGIVLKPNVIISGTENEDQAGPAEVARGTLQVLTSTVPPAVPGVAFLSGGQSNEQACANLAAINAQAAAGGAPPWRLTFSFGRALVSDALRAWHGVAANAGDAQGKLAANCRRASEASKGSVTAAAGA